MKSRLAAVLFLTLVLLALFPFAGEKFYIQLVTKVMIMAIFAMSLDLLVGYSGLVSLGHAAFYGLAGYTRRGTASSSLTSRATPATVRGALAPIRKIVC